MVMGTLYWDEAHKAGGWPGIGFCPIFETWEQAMASAAKSGSKVVRVGLTPVTKTYVRDDLAEAK